MPLKCPRCNGDMAPMLLEDVEYDRCGDCRGLWFDAFEHEALRVLPESASIDTGPAAVATTGKARMCPRCAVRMIEMVVPVQTHIHVESCPVCHGEFFDAGEFADYREETLRETLRALAAAVRK
jgi:Zn-finger nucleic acid-binding protein